MPVFTQNFTADFLAVTAGLARDYDGPPYAFARWADGEYAVAFGKHHRAQSDGWEWRAGQRNLLSDCLLDSLAYAAPGWHVGITAESHHRQQHNELLRYVNVDRSYVTFAEIFIFANYQRFWQLDFSHCLTVGPKGDYFVPPNGVEKGWLWHQLADQLIEESCGPILVAAGPLSNAIIYEYWRRSAHCPERRQVIIDVGSALRLQPRYVKDPVVRTKAGRKRLKGRLLETRNKITRRYQRCEDPSFSWVPSWKLADGEAEGPPVGDGLGRSGPSVAGEKLTKTEGGI